MTDPHPYLSGLQPLAMRFGLERMERALEALGHPERRYPVLHVGGTNGKGSTCAMAAAALADAGHAVGLYTSPHLVRFNERIQVRGIDIDDGALAAAVDEIRRACPWHDAGSDGDRLTYFEFATLAGLVHFAHARVDVAVVEVGLGGRFDATTAVEPKVTAVARIGLDHTQLLGDTVEQIAFEKAGIFKRGVPAVVHAHQPPGALEVLRAEAALRVLHPGRPVELVFGVLADKDHAGMLRALVPVARRLHVVAPATPRARAAADVLAHARALGASADVHADVAEALACARRAAADGGLVCVAGSLYLVGEARAMLGEAGPPR